MDQLISLIGFVIAILILYAFSPLGPLFPITQGIIGGGIIGGIIAIITSGIAWYLGISVFGLTWEDLTLWSAAIGAVIGVFITFSDAIDNLRG